MAAPQQKADLAVNDAAKRVRDLLGSLPPRTLSPLARPPNPTCKPKQLVKRQTQVQKMTPMPASVSSNTAIYYPMELPDCRKPEIFENNDETLVDERDVITSSVEVCSDSGCITSAGVTTATHTTDTWIHHLEPMEIQDKTGNFQFTLRFSIPDKSGRICFYRIIYHMKHGSEITKVNVNNAQFVRQ